MSDWPSAQWDPNQWPQINGMPVNGRLCLGIQAMSGRHGDHRQRRHRKRSAPGGHQNYQSLKILSLCFQPLPHIHPILSPVNQKPSTIPPFPSTISTITRRANSCTVSTNTPHNPTPDHSV